MTSPSIVTGHGRPRPAAFSAVVPVVAFLALAVSPGDRARAGGLPDSWGGSASVGYNTNILGSSRAERLGFETEDPSYYFAINRLEDWQINFGLWSRWNVPSFYKKLRVDVDYERRQIARNPILGLDTWQVTLRQRLRNHNRWFDLALTLEPQVYMRHRGDGGAIPGSPAFRPEAYRGFEAKLDYNHPIGPLQGTAFAGREIRRENRWFRWRNETRDGVGLGARIPARKGIDISPSFEFGSCSSPGDATNRTDRSYREWVTGIFGRVAIASLKGPWVGQVGTRWKFRRYTTGDPLDASRFHRRDRLYSWSARIDRPMGWAVPFLSIEGSGRTVSLPAGATASSDEGEYTATLVRTGIEWEFDRSH